MKNAKLLVGLAMIGGGLFLATRTSANASALPSGPIQPVIPGTGGATATSPDQASGGGMAPSKAAADLLMKRVGFLAMPRQEASGAIIIGYGHKVLPTDPEVWRDITKSTTMTPLTVAQGEALFLKDIVDHAYIINTLVNVPLNQNQYDALTLLVFNIGVENFANSTLLRVLNEKDYASAAEQFLVWNKRRDAAGNLVADPALTALRESERVLFMTPVVEVPGAVPPTQTPIDPGFNVVKRMTSPTDPAFVTKATADLGRGVKSPEAGLFVAFTTVAGGPAKVLADGLRDEVFNKLITDLANKHLNGDSSPTNLDAYKAM
jgi:lysozyme